MRGGGSLGGQETSVFVHAQGKKAVQGGGGVKKWQNSVHVVVECPFSEILNYLWIQNNFDNSDMKKSKFKICLLKS